MQEDDLFGALTGKAKKKDAFGALTEAPVARQEAAGEDERLNLLSSLAGGPGLNRAREAGIVNPQGTIDAPPLRAPGPVAPAPSLMDDPLGAKSFGNWAAYQAERGLGFLHGVGISASVPLVGAVHGTGAAEYQAERAKMAFEGDPRLAGRPSRDELLESVPFSGAPGLDPVPMMAGLPRLLTARRLSVADREALMLREVTIPEGKGSITRITPSGDISVNIGGKTVDTTIDAIDAPALRGADEAVSTASKGGAEAPPAFTGSVSEAGVSGPVPSLSKEVPFTGIVTDPAKINEKVWYHGTDAPNLKGEQLDPFSTKIEGLFGPGIYLTDSPDIAEGYRRARMRPKYRNAPGEGAVYAAKVNIRKAINMEEAAPPEVLDAFRRAAKGPYLRDEDEFGFLNQALAKKDVTPETLYQAMQDDLARVSADERIPSYEFTDIFSGLADDFKASGYDALTHTGGLRTKSPKHQVIVLLDPNNAYTTQGGKVVNAFDPAFTTKGSTAGGEGGTFRAAMDEPPSLSKGGATVPPAPPPSTKAQGPLPPPAGKPSTGSTILQYILHGEKGAKGGPDFAAATTDFQRKMRNVNALSTSEGLSLKGAFEAVDKDPIDAWEAIYANHFHGTPIPEDIAAKYQTALPEMRRTLSDYAALRENIVQIHPELKDEYPIFMKRISKEKGTGEFPSGNPTMPFIGNERADAFNTYAQGMTVETAEDMMLSLPPELRPIQATAPGASKGLLIKVEDGVGIKWPDTPQGEAGQQAFNDLVENLRTQGVPGTKGVRLHNQRPIPLTESGQFDKNIPVVMAKTWAEGYRMKFTEDYLKSLIGMTDQADNPLTTFVSHDDMTRGLTPKGFTILDKGARKWGPLSVAEQGGQKGVYAVRDDVAGMLQEATKNTSGMADFAHGALDANARDVTSGMRTNIFNRLWNKIVVDSGNGLWPGSPIKREAMNEIRQYEKTGIMPDDWKLGSVRGVPLEVPDNIAGLLEDEEALLEKSIASSRPAERYEFGKEFYRVATGSTLAKDPVKGAIGGAAQGAARALMEGEGPMGIALRSAGGAAASTALRPVARAVSRDLLQSDLLSTYGAFKKHLRDFRAKGYSEAEAADLAAARTIRTTQAGQWSEAGGFSEAIAGKPSGILGTQRTPIRAAQRAIFNRFLSWPENAIRVSANQLKESPESRIGLMAGAAALYGIKKGLPEVAVRTGQITREEKDALEKGRPWDVIVPTPFGARWISGRSLEHPLANLPTTAAEVPGLLAGPVGSMAFEGVTTATGEGKRLFPPGAPLQRDEPHKGTEEDPWEALLKSTQTRFSSPWAPTGYPGMAMERQIRDAAEPLPGVTPPSLLDISLTPFLGQTRPVVSDETKVGLIRAFKARWREINVDARRVSSKTPSLMDDTQIQMDRRRRALIQEYLDKGLTEADLPILEEEPR